EDVRGAAPLHDGAEEVPGDLLRAQAAALARCVGDPVLRLQAVDALHASSSSLRKVRRPSAARSSSAASTPVPESSASPIASRPVRRAAARPSPVTSTAASLLAIAS